LMRFTKRILISQGSRGREFKGGGSEDTEVVLTFDILTSFLNLFSYDWMSRWYTLHWHGDRFRTMQVEFPCALNLPSGHQWAVPTGCGTWGSVQLLM
jgi:hypothetical protein